MMRNSPRRERRGERRCIAAHRPFAPARHIHGVGRHRAFGGQRQHLQLPRMVAEGVARRRRRARWAGASGGSACASAGRSAGASTAQAGRWAAQAAMARRGSARHRRIAPGPAPAPPPARCAAPAPAAPPRRPTARRRPARRTGRRRGTARESPAPARDPAAIVAAAPMRKDTASSVSPSSASTSPAWRRSAARRARAAAAPAPRRSPTSSPRPSQL